MMGRTPLQPLHQNTLHRPSSKVSKPQPLAEHSTHASRLKYRLQLAYYRLRTDQVGVPLAEILKNGESHRAKTPSLTRHVSLLAASTPFPKPLKRSVSTAGESLRKSSLHIRDLVHREPSVTPVKRAVEEHGDALMSSPTKKLCSSTPASYGAARSLLQLSLISSN